MHEGLRIEGAHLFIHYDAEKNVEVIHGNLAKNISPGKSVGISEKAALNIGLSKVNAKAYKWESPQWEEQIKRDKEDPQATFYPCAELMYVQLVPDNFQTNNFRLAYKFDIATLEPTDHFQVMIDARNGEVLRLRSLEQHATGTVNSLYNGPRSFTTYYRGFPTYDFVLKDLTRGQKIHTLIYSNSSGWSEVNEVHDNDNVWSEVAASTHWAVQVAWDYFSQKYNRNGMDEAGGKIRVQAESFENYFYGNLFYGEGGYDYLRFGKATSGVNGNFATLDLVGHEFTHGVAHHEDMGDPPLGETAALVESFGDIFGVMVERFVTGNVNWTIGEDTGYTLRSLSNPNQIFSYTSIASPDTYKGTYWNTSTRGQHYNNGVQNFWFYLLANGGSGVNDLGNPYNVQGIGIDNAANIAYKNLNDYMYDISTYASAREGSINAAKTLFGECSQQYVSTVNAWHAVGVGNSMPVCGSAIGFSNNSICIENNYFSTSFFLTTYPINANVTWYVPSNWDYSISGNGKLLNLNSISYPQVGSQELTAEVSMGGQSVIRYTFLDIIECNVYCNGCPQPLTTKSESSALNIFPNPASNRVEISAAWKEEDTATIMDASGRTVMIAKVKNGGTDVDISALPPGIYWVVITNGAARKVKKLIVNR
jgi:Zn-dependent metalloprotease